MVSLTEKKKKKKNVKEVQLLLLVLSHLSCPTLCDPRDRSPPGSSVPGILQARTLEWAAGIGVKQAGRYFTILSRKIRGELVAFQLLHYV